MRRITIGSAILLMVVALAVAAAADVPRLINYQGLLTDANGHPLYGQYLVRFSVYGSLGGSDTLWTESHVVDVYEGLFDVILGSVAPIPGNLFEDEGRWMGITVGYDPEISPRMQLTSVPFALRAAVAETSLTVGAHNHDADYVNEDQPNSVSGAMITDGEVADADVSVGAAIDPSKISGTAWTSTNDGSGSGLDADMLDGIHAADFATGLKSWESTWFHVSTNETVTLTHNLGTYTMIFFSVLFSPSGATVGSQLVMPVETRTNTDGNQIAFYGLRIENENQVTLRTANERVALCMDFATGEPQSFDDGWYRVIILALQ